MGWWVPGAFLEPGHHSLLAFRTGPQWGLRFHPSSAGGLVGSLVNSIGKESACKVGDPGSSLGWEDPLEKGMATHSSILACRISWTEESGGLQSVGSQRVGHD